MTTKRLVGGKIVPIIKATNKEIKAAVKAAGIAEAAKLAAGEKLPTEAAAEKALSDTALRALRTFVQAAAALLVVTPVATSWSGERDVAFAALSAGAAAVVALAQNTLETYGILPSTK